MSEQKKPSMLSPFRVLDLTDEKGFFCGKLLGDFGADVIKVEPPGGDPSRKIGPFYHDSFDPEQSLYWFAFNTSKRGITLNIETADGQAIFKRLAKKADFVIESFAPGYLDKLGIGYSALSKINPRIILTSITPFGQTGGPYKDYKISDLSLWALSGYMYVTGDTDRAPVRITFPQTSIHAGTQAAGATLTAHYYREMTGAGQTIDVSMLEVLIDMDGSSPGSWWRTKEILKRRGRSVVRPDGLTYPSLWPCKDGYICFTIQTNSKFMNPLIEWMEKEGKATDAVRINWGGFNLPGAPKEEMEPVMKAFADFFMSHTRDEIYEEALKRRLMIAPVVTSAKSVLDNPQLAARDFWTQLEHPELGTTLPYPGGCAILSETPIQISRRAPLIGEHNDEIYRKEMGFSKKEMGTMKQSGII